MDDLRGGHPDNLSREPRIGAVARMAAEEVIGHTAPDPIELDSLPDRVAVPGHARFMQRQHLRGQHLQLKWHRQPILNPPRPDPDKDLTCQKHLARGAAL